MSTILSSGGVAFGSGGVLFSVADSYPAYPVTPTGPPAGFTGFVAPGYVPPGDPRITSFIEDSNLAPSDYNGPWARAFGGKYHNGDTSYVDGPGAAASTYYGGSFRFWAQRYNGFGTGRIYVGNALVANVDLYDPGELVAAPVPLQLVGGGTSLVLTLPEGLHAFRCEWASGRFLFDAIELLPKP